MMILQLFEGEGPWLINGVLQVLVSGSTVDACGGRGAPPYLTEPAMSILSSDEVDG